MERENLGLAHFSNGLEMKKIGKMSNNGKEEILIL